LRSYAAFSISDTSRQRRAARSSGWVGWYGPVGRTGIDDHVLDAAFDAAPEVLGGTP
jgi:hypothetical protein